MNLPSLFPDLLPEAVLLVTAFAVIGLSMTGAAKQSGIALLRLVAVTGIVVAVGLCQLTSPAAAGSTCILHIDPLAKLGRLWILLLAFPAVLIAPDTKPTKFPGEFLALMMFAIIGLSLAAASQHFLLLFVGLELTGLCSYLLTAWTRTRAAASASIRYFLFGGTSAAFFLFGISLVYGSAPELTLLSTSRLSQSGAPLPMVLGLLMMVLGLGFKLSAAPLHGWAPEVYEKGNGGLVALVAGASKLTALIVLTRLCFGGFPGLAGSAAWGHWQAGWAPWLAALATVSMILGNLLALGQTGVRRLLACSAIANAGYALVGLASAKPDAAAMAIFHMTVYALATTGAIAITMEVESSTGSDSFDSFKGLYHRSPLQAAFMAIFLGSLASLPPMAGFFGKFGLFVRALSDPAPGLAWLVGLGALMSAVSLFYYLSVLRRIFEPAPATAAPASRCTSHPIWPVIAVVLLGLFPGLLLTPLTRALEKIEARD